MPSITITADAANAQRAAHAIGKVLAFDPPRDATLPEITQWLRQQLIQQINSVEHDEQTTTAATFT